MRLIDDDQPRVNVQNRFVKWNARFILTADFAVIINRFTRAIFWYAFPDKIVPPAAATKPLLGFVRANRAHPQRKAFAQKTNKLPPI